MPATPKSLVRRLLKPLTRPLDGRIGDVNRRIHDVREDVAELERKVGAQTATVTEANSYLGVELRRFHEEIDQLRRGLNEYEQRLFERVDSLEQRDYADRLDRASRLHLAHLDGPLAGLINHAVGHRGFYADAGLWFNPPLTVELAEGSASLREVNERIVELPFAFGALARLKPSSRILDIGSAESTFSLSAASLGYRVTALDLRPMPYEHPNLESVVGRFEDWDARERRFDAIFMISTVEHIGLGAYGDDPDAEDADRRALARTKELLTDDGLLVLTTPFGRRQVDEFQRVYDDSSLAELLSGWTLVERRIVDQLDDTTWTPSASSQAPEDTRGVALVVASATRSEGPGATDRSGVLDPQA
jgi:2-polyprenyl-3-methyl-5-hydroxy-6-metoxy-1,4-benzoquinol methylase